MARGEWEAWVEALKGFARHRAGRNSPKRPLCYAADDLLQIASAIPAVARTRLWLAAITAASQA
jgi:hypothetical protein